MPISPKTLLFPSALFILGLTGLTAIPAQAQNLVKDGTFEAADPGALAGDENAFAVGDQFDNDWQITQGTVAIDTTNEYVYDGSKSLYLNADLDTGSTVSQSFQTQAGKNYLLSFYADDGSNNPLTITFGATTLGPLTITQNGYPNSDPGSNASSFTFYQYDVTAASSLTTLAFSTPTNIAPGIELDDISVTQAPVPEASAAVSFGLLLAFGGLALVVRRRVRA